MVNLTQLLNAAKTTDTTIQEIVACQTDSFAPNGFESYAAIRAGKDQYTKEVEYFQVIIKNKGLANEQAFFVGKCPCESDKPSPTEFETWLDGRIATELANDPTIEEVIKEYVDSVQGRAQLLVIRNNGTTLTKTIAFVYTARDGTHKVQYQNY